MPRPEVLRESEVGELGVEPRFRSEGADLRTGLGSGAASRSGRWITIDSMISWAWALTWHPPSKSQFEPTTSVTVHIQARWTRREKIEANFDKIHPSGSFVNQPP